MEYNGSEKAVETAIVEILQQQLTDIVDADNIFIQDQNKKIPNNNKTFIAVRMVDARVITNVNRVDTSGAGIKEIQEIVTRENIQIDMFSKSNVPVLHRSRVLMALNSLFAKEIQSRYNFKVYKVPTSFVNSSSAEGGSQYNRYTLVIATNVWYRHEIESPEPGYYDTFDTRVDDEETIGEADGLIEFQITEE